MLNAGDKHKNCAGFITSAILQQFWVSALGLVLLGLIAQSRKKMCSAALVPENSPVLQSYR